MSSNDLEHMGWSTCILTFFIFGDFPAKCISLGECSQHGLYPGFPLDRDAILNAKIVVLQTKHSLLCEASVWCKHVCIRNCSECTFFEMIKVSLIVASATWLIQQTTTKIMCYCFKSSGKLIIQPSLGWYHGFIFDSVLATGGKNSRSLPWNLDLFPSKCTLLNAYFGWPKRMCTGCVIEYVQMFYIFVGYCQ